MSNKPTIKIMSTYEEYNSDSFNPAQYKNYIRGVWKEALQESLIIMEWTDTELNLWVFICVLGWKTTILQDKPNKDPLFICAED